ncbi:MAG: hypothetical protein E4H05_06745 [Acidimicrobiales bacterium]|nr:MAG: hypothetical protein E4H05_06745 [Acidimicrobiales bacterium]
MVRLRTPRRTRALCPRGSDRLHDGHPGGRGRRRARRPDPLMSDQERIQRLERRLERERRAREEAEQIAERGMRDLWLANQELEARVAARTVDLERSLRAAHMASEAKETFLAELGHELATPLHAVLGLLELIDSDTLAGDDRARLEQAATNARQLADLLFGLI